MKTVFNCQRVFADKIGDNGRRGRDLSSWLRHIAPPFTALQHLPSFTETWRPSRPSLTTAPDAPEGRAPTTEKEARMSDLILMVRLFVGIFYPKAVEPLQKVSAFPTTHGE